MVDPTETGVDRLWRRLREDPLTPIGSVLTAAALTYATVQLRRGNQKLFQRALRYRVAFQAVTVGTAAVGLLYFRTPKSRVPPPGPDGKPQKLEAWNPEKIERRERETDAEWRARMAGAQSRDDREMQAIERMVQEAIQRRKEREQQAPARSDAPSDTPAPSVLDRIGQDKRRFTF
ncbi:Respiratory supercomplex factor 1, mitochondrial [Malassezia restricta CBS 7877]|uniref:Respiratory supercomplex factor 1, mitochondrial n=1 Tax=Malassezia restricta (strain ATCC 96810 / NBRC 103918 / CBS 7877) TaxID=425264 RepID=A0A3G2S6J4_MALR7|nr:Respiratory supercomplex factor 1, mitochondrial [Malassezia restricta CBS 7877]